MIDEIQSGQWYECIYNKMVDDPIESHYSALEIIL
jgi:hypothetical protein